MMLSDHCLLLSDLLQVPALTAECLPGTPLRRHVTKDCCL